MFLNKRSNGYFYAHFKNNEGKWLCVSTGTKNRSEAHQFFSDLEQNVRRPIPKILLSEFVTKYLDYSKHNNAPRTTYKAKLSLRYFISHLGDRPIDKIGPIDVESYKAHRFDMVSPVTVNIELRAIKASFGVAVRWEILERNPFKGVRLLRIPQRAPVFFSREELDKVVCCVRDGWLQKITLFAVNTGMRRGELVNLKWENVDLNRRVLRVCNSDTFQTKSRTERTIPLNQTAYSLLVTLPRISQFVFVAEKGGKVNEEKLSNKFRAAILKSGVNPRLHFHSLRHTFATWLVQNGAGIYEVQKLLGHSSIAVTQVYSHLQPEQLHSTVNRIVLSQN